MIRLEWPPSELAGNTRRHWRTIAAITKKHREWARLATMAANLAPLPPTGDVAATFTFYPPNNRGDRVNMPGRLKPAIDGMCDALGINDRSILPSYRFAEPVKEPCVIVTLATD